MKERAVQKMGGLILTIYMPYDVFRKELPFGGHDDCTSIKIFRGVNFFNCD